MNKGKYVLCYDVSTIWSTKRLYKEFDDMLGVLQFCLDNISNSTIYFVEVYKSMSIGGKI